MYVKVFIVSCVEPNYAPLPRLGQGALAETIATPEERPAVSLSYAEVEADQLDRSKMGINKKNFNTGELAPVGICSELTYAPPREARIPTETVAAPETRGYNSSPRWC
jgi:hypothetical protein